MLRANTPVTLSRRHCLQMLAALGLSVPLAGLLRAERINKPTEYWLSAQGRQTSRYGLGWLANGSNITSQLSGFRGHAVLAHPSKAATAVFLARRPETHALEVDLASGSIRPAFQCAPQRHLFGHGCFSADGNTLFTTEADIKTGHGKIVLRDAKTYRQLDEYDSHGIGPHEVKLMPDGNSLVIANGGILTRPNSGRTPLNLATMDSNLSYVNSFNGALISRHKVSEPKASIRHIDVAPDGTVAIAMQVQRNACKHDNLVSLSAIHAPNKDIALLQAPEPLLKKMDDYIGSVAINSASRTAGFTSPKGDLVAFWHLDNQQFIGYHSLHDACGIATSTDNKEFIITSSSGQVRHLDASTLAENTHKRLHFPKMHWDNHLTVAIL